MHPFTNILHEMSARMSSPIRRSVVASVLTLCMAYSGMAHAQVALTASDSSIAWVTTPSKRMERQPVQALSTSTKATKIIDIYPATTLQRIDGLGWMLNQGSAKLLMQMPAAERHALLEELYGKDGLNASMVRVAIGACDLSESDYTYADTEDKTLSNFAIAKQDQSTVIPILQEIISIHPDVRVLATSWTAPVWMKTGTAWYNGYVDGTLKTEYYDLYAEYFCRYIEAMQAWNIPIWGISVQNEPLNGHNDPSMTWTKESMYRFIAGNLGPALANRGHSAVRIIAYDHNCDDTTFPTYVAKSKYVYGTAFHLYAGDVSALSTVYNNTGKPVLFTEQYTGKDGDFAGDLKWHVQNVVLGALNNYASTSLEWNLCSDPTYSIHTSGGCTTCMGAVTLNNGSLQARNVSYYIIGHASRVIDGGAKRISSTSATSNISYVSALNPDGSIGIVVYNDASQSSNIAFAIHDQPDGSTLYATRTLPGNSVLSVRLMPTIQTSVAETHSDSPLQYTAKMIMRNGTLLIQSNEHLYTIDGTQVE